MPYSPTTVPEISVSPAPPQEPINEPYSPFSSIKYPDNDDGFRPRLLTPPPSSSLRTRHSSSPCSGGYNSDEERFDYNEGLDRYRFEALLQATRERNARRPPDLRREVTLKAHNAKQIGRRARFITRVLSGPLTQAVSSNSLAPPTVPLSSPDAFASFRQASTKPEISSSPGDEMAYYSGIQDKNPSKLTSQFAKGNIVPSLDEISARLASQGYVCNPRSKQSTTSSLPRSVHLQSPHGNIQIHAPQPLPSPKSCNHLVLSTEPASPTRASRAHDMLSALRRRTSPPVPPINTGEGCDMVDKKRKRHSAPGDLFSLQARVDFQHPVLSMPGGF
ncbi:hypothetical protein APHAL10511_006229 [Amanita phalloides]|nr:hypothetical protein APHAL10511_006229 [Amanita phalloides]